MAHYVMLTRISVEAMPSPSALEELESRVKRRIETDCPEVRWIASYAVLGSYDYVDVFEAPDNESATKVSLIVRSLGHANTETWPAVEWPRFRALVRETSRN